MNQTNNNDDNPFKQKITWAGFRLGLWPLIVYLIMIVLSYFSESFVGLTSPWQNILYGICAASPFWITILLFLWLTGRELLEKKNS